ncbi:SDR family NAD(P)-dependent oxidoreductase [Nonomuraea sp. NPDC050790]|uniref:type I polyketide synthase n=1 Tax=Nonomuraea sp. NPDC050790 TaxID=3364371 RepID=UPI00378C3BD1
MVGESNQLAGIAVVGMSCRLPQAADPARFWHLLRDGVDAVTAAPADRWPNAADYRFGGFLEDVEGFDAAFFGISPNEAAAMDPHQRLVLELAWEALENARVLPAELRGSAAGVFLGAISNDFAALRAGGRHGYTGANRAMIANRVSYLLGLRGPSLTLDAGQSSSLVAVQMACESLRRGEIGLAVAGGVNLNLLGETTNAIGEFGALSPDGRCHTFDARANGYVRGEGGGLVVLKPLAAAVTDRDVIHAVILGGAVNNDGGGEGLTVPSGRAQAEVIESACAQAGVAPGAVQYVELHGTGTKVGDPIEATALGSVYGKARPAAEPLLVGSVKTNIGHLEGAAGIAGLLKVILSLKHRELPASLHFETPSPDIPFDSLRLRVVPETLPWSARRLVAGVSSFGMGGTNCHLIVTEPPRLSIGGSRRHPAPKEPDGGAPWVFSARSPEALKELAGQLADVEAEPADVAWSLVRSRAAFEHRAVVLGAAKREALLALAAGLPHEAAVTGTGAGRTAFVFPGQGAQWPSMARELLAGSPAFAERVAECALALAPFTDYDLMDVLREKPGAPGLDRVDVVQPALWAVMTGLAALWQSHGLRPDLVIGHSQGEIAAATAVGALSTQDAARVVGLRSKAIAGIAGKGGMMSLAAPLGVIESTMARISRHLAVAAVNGPASFVVSGPHEALAELKARLPEHRSRIIPVNYASHSAEVEQVRDEVLAALAPVRPASTCTTFVSTLTGRPIDTASLDASYWYASLRRPVRFGQAVRVALEHDAGVFVECSPHPVLVSGVSETAEAAGRDVAAVGTLRREDGGAERVMRSLAEAYAGGAEVDWAGPCGGGRLVDLPTYPFQRRRHRLAVPAGLNGGTQAGVLNRGTHTGALNGGTHAGALNGGARSHAADLDGGRSSDAAASYGADQGFSGDVRELVLSTLAALLGHEDASGIEAARTFKNLGVESATALDLRNRLRAATGLRLPTSLLFDHPTPQKLIDHLRALLADEAPVTAAEERVDLDGDPVVVVGMGCRYPGGVASPADLWNLVSEGADAITEFPANRGWDLSALFATGQDRSGTSDTGHGGFLHDADRFDAAFFGISPREAAAMDPQQRLLLEVSWEAVERAGIDPGELRDTATGVFVGAMAPDYGPRLHQSGGVADGHLLTGTALSVVSGRIAYTLGLRGPALTTDTACSSSLVSIVLATQALRRGECSMALAGGVTVMSTPGMFVEFSRQGGLARDGRCKAFSAGADGTGWAEGAGMLLLERLSDARRNGHPVLAVIRGGAINQDGASNGLTAPSGLAQQAVMRQALADARLTAADVDVVEAHGTGTTLGDPIEAESVMSVYDDVWLGSFKSNVGHTQAAAGVGGVIKMVKALEHRVLPRTLHADEPSPHVDWSAGNVRLLTSPVELPDGRTLRAAVSSFGISGTNAHLIIEQAPSTNPPTEHPGQNAELGSVPGSGLGAGSEPVAWVLSGRSESALRAQAVRLREVAGGDSDLVAVGRALARKAAFAYRAVVVARDRAELVAALDALAAGEPHGALVTGVADRDVQPVFVFPGQGSQWAGMAVELLDSDEVFRTELRRCDAALRAHTGWSVEDALRAEGKLEGSDVIQPVLFAVMVALAKVWRSLGVEPSAVLGHSQGEIIAACVAGALSLEDAAKVVVLRSRALTRLGDRGGMVALPVPVERAGELIEPWAGRLWPAVHSGPESCVIGGDADALEEFTAAHGESLNARRVAIGYAAHTPHIEALREEIRTALAGIEPRAGQVAFCSSYKGGPVEHAELTADYWYTSLRNPVRFQEAVESFAGTPLFVETSPHPVLTGHVQDTLTAAGRPGGATGTLRRGDGGRARLLTALAQAHVLGARVDWPAALGAGPLAEVPTYPFERQRYWLDGTAGGADVSSTGLDASRHPLLGAAVPLAAGDGHLLTGRLSLAAAPWLADHAVDGTVLLPGTAFVELALEAAATVGAASVEDLTLEAPLRLSAEEAVQLQLTVSAPGTGGHRDLSVHARPAGDPDTPWTRHATGALSAALPTTEPLTSEHATAAEPSTAGGPLGAWPPAGAVEVDLDDAYERLAERGYSYGPAFQGLRAAWRLGEDAYVEVDLPEHVSDGADRFTLHPALLDAALHLLVLDAAGEPGTLLLPFAWSGVHAVSGGARTLRVRLSPQGQDRHGLTVYDVSGAPIAVAGSLTLRAVPRTGLAPAAETYGVDWTELPQPKDEPTTGPERSAVTWATVGYDAFADEVGGQRYYDLASLADMSVEAPDAVLVPFEPDADDLPYSVHDALYQALDLVQGWVGDERFWRSRMVFVTRGPGVVTGPLWGLVRSAQAEHPGRFALADVDAGFTDWELLAATDEPQVRARDGVLLAPRLTRRTGGPAGATPASPGTADPHSPSPAQNPAQAQNPAVASAAAQDPAVASAPAQNPAQAQTPAVASTPVRNPALAGVLAQGTVLVTGGTGALGGLVAERLVERHGVRDLVLVSRSGPNAEGAAELAGRLEGLGAQVRVAACDVSDRDALGRLVAGIPELAGVVHTAAVLDDATVAGLSATQLDTVLAPKADAAWRLHELAGDRPLILFSSVAGVIGTAGQANYAAANAFLDALAEHRHTLGLPAVSVAWGAWETGMAGELSGADAVRMSRAGVAALTAEQGLDLFDAVLSAPAAEPLVVAARWDAAALRQRAEAGELASILRGLVRAPRRTAEKGGAERNGAAPAAGPMALVERLAVMAEPDARNHLTGLVRSHVAAVLGHGGADRVGVDKSFNELGFDSLTAVELRNRLNADTGLRLPATLVFDHPTVSALAEHLFQSLAPQTPSPEDTLRGAVEKVESMLLAANGEGEGIKGRLVAILQSALSRFGSGGTAANGAAEKIVSASDEEIFALIDNRSMAEGPDHGN